jgi:hypothetical protein
MNGDSWLTLPVRIWLAAMEYSFAQVGWVASASADALATARLRMLLSSSERPPKPAQPEQGMADVIVLADERKHER